MLINRSGKIYETSKEAGGIVDQCIMKSFLFKCTLIGTQILLWMG